MGHVAQQFNVLVNYSGLLCMGMLLESFIDFQLVTAALFRDQLG